MERAPASPAVKPDPRSKLKRSIRVFQSPALDLQDAFQTVAGNNPTVTVLLPDLKIRKVLVCQDQLGCPAYIQELHGDSHFRKVFKRSVPLPGVHEFRGRLNF